MARQQDAEDSDEESEAGGSQPGRGAADRRAERRWWHVPDEQIERLVRNGRSSSSSSAAGQGSMAGGQLSAGTREQLALRASAALQPTLQGGHKRTVRFQDEQGDALDAMLRTAELSRQRLEEELRPAEDEESGDESEDEMDWTSLPLDKRPKDWWRVPDERIDKMIGKLSKATAKRATSLGSSATFGATALAALGASASPARGRQPPGAAAGGRVTLHVLMVETGETLSLRVPICLKAGPGRPPPPNPLTDVFGQSASSRGFEATAFSFECSFRFSAGRRPRWISVKASSLKGLVALATELEPARQRLCFRGGAVTLDDMTVRSYGFRDGELMELHALPPPSSMPPPKREVVLACTRKRHEVKEKPVSRKPITSATGYGVLHRSDGDVQILPRWNKNTSANVFAKVGIAVDGDGSHRVKPDFGREPIYLPDDADPRIRRVREAVSGHSHYVP